MSISLTDERRKKINEFKNSLKEINDKVLSLIKDLNWDYQKLLDDSSSNMVICNVNKQHKVPSHRIKAHEERCSWHQEGYRDDDKTFSDFCGYGSVVKITSELMKSITDGLPSSISSREKRLIPQTSANLDQNFSREEKLAIYDYVIANTQKQISLSDTWPQISEKKEEKREMTAWEIAAAERDAKRRRASYRNKVHTNRKTHTEVLREVIEVQMEALKEEHKFEEKLNKNERDNKRDKSDRNKYNPSAEKKYSEGESSSHRDKERRHRQNDRERHSRHRNHSHKRSPSVSGSDTRSRSHDKYRKWKTHEGRSHSHKSSHSHRKS